MQLNTVVIKLFNITHASTVYIQGFYVENSAKLYLSCGICKSGYQGKRQVELTNVKAKNIGVLVGINLNYGDTAIFKNVT